MTRICVVGGRLQGLEAVYLAKEAGYTVGLVDKEANVPAKGLADEFYNMDLLADNPTSFNLLKTFDLVLPATENLRTLAWLNRSAVEAGLTVALDYRSYNITSSKIRSNNLLTGVVDLPEPWPRCGFPVIVKPSGLSGSSGVSKAEDEAQLAGALKKITGDPVIQSFIDGPSYSLEVLAHRGDCISFQITELEFDASYDCKRVIAGPGIGDVLDGTFRKLGEDISRALNLSGIMDIEVIDDGVSLKTLEIDARLPSQTPSAVYHSTGINMVQMLTEYWIQRKLPETAALPRRQKAVIYEHLRFSEAVLEVAGEHIIRDAENLKVYRNKFLADTLISNFENCSTDWVATAVYVGDTLDQVWETRNHSLKKMSDEFKATDYLDTSPFHERR